MTFRRSSVAFVVTSVLVGVTTLLLGTLGAISHMSTWSRELSRLQRAAAVQADELAVALALPVWNIDRAQIDEIAKGMEATPAVSGVVIQAAGRTHARARDADWGLVAVEGRIPVEGLIVQDRPIVFSGERIGTVRLLVTTRFVERELRESLLSIVLTILATDILLVLCVSLVLWRAVVRPLRSIERWAGAVSAGGGGPPADAGSTAELGSLKTSIETMVEALSNEKEFTDAALDAMTGLFYVRDSSFRIVRRNRMLDEFVGSGGDRLSLVVPEDQEKIREAMSAVFERGYAETEVRVRLGEELRHFLLNGRRMEIGGKPYLVGTGADITELRRAESERAGLQAAVVQSAAEWRQTFDSVSTPMIVTDPSGVVRRLNRSAADLAGLGLADAVGRRIGELGQGPWKVAAGLIRSLESEGERSGAEAHDAAGRSWQVNFNRLAAGGTGGALVVFFWDVTSIVELQTSLRRSERMSAMGALVAGVAHEVRNPLFGISATIDSYEAELHRPEYRELAESLKSQVQRLSKLMQELLDYGKPVVLSIEQGSLLPVVAEAARSREASARQAGVTVAVDVPANLPSLLYDSGRLRQVFENLVDNAVQHARPGDVVRITAEEVEHAGRRWVDCRVEDEGEGFPAGDLESVFEPFFTKREGGTGLGLAIVQRIVEEHSGEVFAANRPGGRGAVVTVRLPMAAATASGVERRLRLAGPG